MSTKKPVILDASNQPANLQSGDYLRSDSLGSGSAGAGLKVLLDNNTFGNPPSGSLVYSNTSVPVGDTVASTAAETTFTDPSYSIPANSLVAGSVIRIYLWGVYGTAAVDVTKTIQIKIKLNGTTYLATGALTTVLSLTNDGWSAEAFLTIFTIGATGTVDAQGYFEFETAATTALNVNVPNTGTQVIDTTISQAITVTVQWGTSSASNTITLRQALIYVDNLSTSSTAGTFLQVANNLSDVSNAKTARKNLRVGTMVAKNYTPASGTSTTNEELLHSWQIAASEVDVNDLLDFFCTTTNTSSANNKTFRLYINNANSLTSAVLVATVIQTTNQGMGFARQIYVLSDTTVRVHLAAANNVISAYNGNTASGPATITVPSLAAGFWILISGQKATAGETETVDGGRLICFKA